MNIEATLRDFVSSFDPRIKDASGVTEIYYAFSTLYDGPKWTEQCQQNMAEIYERAKDLLEQLKSNKCPEDAWPILDDLAFHAAIFGCHYHILNSVLEEDITSEGIRCNNLSEIVENDQGTDLRQVLESTIKSFENLAEAFMRREVVAQRRHLTELYIASSHLQCFAGRARLCT